MDASVCLLFYLPKGRTAVLDERSYNAKKPHNLAKLNHERVIRWLIVDHYSGAFFAFYTLGSEDAKTAVDMLIQAMCRRGTDDPLCGRPVILYTDPGPAYTAALFQTLVARTGIRHITHKPGQARATGSVEVHQRIVQDGFEGRLRSYNAADLAALNVCLDAWRIQYNAEHIHSRYNKTRNALWLTIPAEHLHIPADADTLRALATTPPKTVKVKGSLIIEHTPKGYGRQSYSLRHVPGVMPGSFVGVSVNAFEAPAIDVIVTAAGKPDVTYTVQPITRNAAGFDVSAPVIGEEYKAAPDTAADKALKDIERMAYAAPTLTAAAEAAKGGVRPFGHINMMADVEAGRAHKYLPRSGQEFAGSARAKELPPISHYEAFMRLRPELDRAGIEWTPEHMAALKRQYPHGVPVEALDTLAAGFMEERAAERRSAMRLAAGGDA
jgi:hypothetical protein